MSAEEVGISEEAQTEATEVAVEVEGADEGNQSESVGYHDRMRQDPEFAVSEIQKKDSYIGELQRERAKYKGLDQFVDTVGADQLIELASLGHQIRQNPQLQQALQNALNGNTQPSKAEEPEDEIYDPEIKALDAKYRETITKLEGMVEDLNGRLAKTEVASLKGSLTENVDLALARFGGDEEAVEKAKAAILNAIQADEKAAAQGDRVAAQRLEQLSGPQGARTLKMLTTDEYEEYVGRKLAGQKASQQPNGEIIRSKATQDRANTRATAPSDRIEIEPGKKMTSQLMREIMEQATRKAGKDPATLWG